jgi:hypothetical protein
MTPLYGGIMKIILSIIKRNLTYYLEYREVIDSKTYFRSIMTCSRTESLLVDQLFAMMDRVSDRDFHKEQLGTFTFEFQPKDDLVNRLLNRSLV